MYIELNDPMSTAAEPAIKRKPSKFGEEPRGRQRDDAAPPTLSETARNLIRDKRHDLRRFLDWRDMVSLDRAPDSVDQYIRNRILHDAASDAATNIPPEFEEPDNEPVWRNAVQVPPDLATARRTVENSKPDDEKSPLGSRGPRTPNTVRLPQGITEEQMQAEVAKREAARKNRPLLREHFTNHFMQEIERSLQDIVDFFAPGAASAGNYKKYADALVCMASLTPEERRVLRDNLEVQDVFNLRYAEILKQPRTRVLILPNPVEEFYAKIFGDDTQGPLVKAGWEHLQKLPRERRMHAWRRIFKLQNDLWQRLLGGEISALDYNLQGQSLRDALARIQERLANGGRDPGAPIFLAAWRQMLKHKIQVEHKHPHGILSDRLSYRRFMLSFNLKSHKIRGPIEARMFGQKRLRYDLTRDAGPDSKSWRYTFTFENMIDPKDIFYSEGNIPARYGKLSPEDRLKETNRLYDKWKNDRGRLILFAQRMAEATQRLNAIIQRKDKNSGFNTLPTENQPQPLAELEYAETAGQLLRRESRHPWKFEGNRASLTVVKGSLYDRLLNRLYVRAAEIRNLKIEPKAPQMREKPEISIESKLADSWQEKTRQTGWLLQELEQALKQKQPVPS